MRVLLCGLATITIVFILFSIWYHFPIEHAQQYEASTYEGETTTIELRVQKYRKFFKPTVIKGELIHNNKVFSGYSHRISNSAFEQFLMKLDGKVNPASFTLENSQIKFFEWESWTINFGSTDDLHGLYLTHRLEGKDADIYTYLAPASNTQEAQQILNKIYNTDF